MSQSLDLLPLRSFEIEQLCPSLEDFPRGDDLTFLATELAELGPDPDAVEERLSRFDIAIKPIMRSPLRRAENASEVRTLLFAIDWRYQLIACMVILLGGGDRSCVSAVWKAIARGSKAAPQLVAIAFAGDPEFFARAREIAPMATPAALAAILAFCRRIRDLDVEDWISEGCSREDVIQRLEEDRRACEGMLVRDSGHAATRWLEQLGGGRTIAWTHSTPNG